MDSIRTERDGDLTLVILCRGKANALNRAMVEELNDAINAAARDETVRGLVLASDRPRFFSAGFDALEVFGYDRETMTVFFGRFIDLYESLYLLPKPVVGAISGHAFAGGAILALTCDYRVMADGPFGFALNEINLGLVLPPGLVQMTLDAVGRARAKELLLSGSTVTPAQAAAIGLMQELAAPEKVLNQAIEKARFLAAKPRRAFAAMKASLRAAAGPGSRIHDHKELDTFVQQWFSEEAQERKRDLIKSLAAAGGVTSRAEE